MSRPGISQLALAAALIAMATLSACSKPNPPLLNDSQSTSLMAIKSPTPFGVHASADQMIILTGEKLRHAAQTALKQEVARDWPRTPHGLLPQSDMFEGAGGIDVDCPAAAGSLVCTLDFKAPTLAAPHVPVMTRPMQLTAADITAAASAGAERRLTLEIDTGDQPEPASINSGQMTFDKLGDLSVACRDANSGGGPRTSCTVQYRGWLLTIDRPASGAGAAKIDSAMARDLKDAVRLFYGMATYAPTLWRAPRPEKDLIASPANAPEAREGIPEFMRQAINQQNAGKGSASAREEIARNGEALPWRDVTDQNDFETVCIHASKAKAPLMIVTTGPTIDANSVLYKDLWKPFASHVTLVVVHVETDDGPNAWATAFANAIGAQGDQVLTVTDRPMFGNKGCQLGKIYQAPLANVEEVKLVQALNTGRPPVAKPN